MNDSESRILYDEHADQPAPREWRRPRLRRLNSSDAENSGAFVFHDGKKKS